jgi:hypothetical protein
MIKMKQQFEKLKFLLSEKVFLYPILTGVLFTTVELHKNWTISTTTNKILFVLIVLTFCLAVNFLIRLFIKNKIKASLIATLFIITNLYYQYLFNVINELTITKLFFEFINSIHIQRYIVSFLILVVLSITYFIIKSQKKIFNLNLYLNVLLSIFLIFEIGTIVFTKHFNIKLIPSSNQHSGKLIHSILKDKPNIYFILLDSYTSSESLKKYWNFDNSAFEYSLSKKGFYTTHSSKSDYDETAYCLASYLNMTLLNLDHIPLTYELWVENKNNILNLINRSSVIQQIKNSGYGIVNYSIFEIANSKKYYNTVISNNSETLYSFFQLTSLISVGNYIQTKFYLSSLQPTYFPNLKIFQLLKDSIDYKSNIPKFVYAHIMMPHSPFDFDENGNRMTSEYSNVFNNESYLKQLRYTNALVNETVRKILISEKKKPIIIIQGDHGYRFLNNVNSKIQKTEAFSIFSSYLLPDDIMKNLNDSIKPITVFSLLFNTN